MRWVQGEMESRCRTVRGEGRAGGLEGGGGGVSRETEKQKEELRRSTLKLDRSKGRQHRPINMKLSRAFHNSRRIALHIVSFLQHTPHIVRTSETHPSNHLNGTERLPVAELNASRSSGGGANELAGLSIHFL